MNTPLGVASTAASTVCSLVTLCDGKSASQVTAILDDIRSGCDLIASNNERAVKLVRSFKQLSVSQISDIRTPCDLKEVLDDCVRVMSPELKKRRIAVEVKAPPDDAPKWNGYPGRLTQVIVNLIQNVLRYAYADSSEGRVEIRVATQQNADTGFRIEFQDYGKGIAPEIAPRLFEPFATTGRGKGGTGLGLAISRNIVENLLGGRIQVTSVPSQGTTFILELPRDVPETSTTL